MKYSILFLLFSIICYSQRNSSKHILTTVPASLSQITEQFDYNKEVSKENKGSIFFELHPELTPLDFPNTRFYIEENTNYFIGYIVNDTNENLNIQLQDGSLFIIQEAKNKNGYWLPIEHWIYSDCGNSYDTSLNLDKKKYAAFPVKIYTGNYKTMIRLKMFDSNTKKIYYSNPFNGYINYSNFKKSNLKKDDYMTYFDN